MNMRKMCKWFGLLAALMLCAALVTAPVSAAGLNVEDTSLSDSVYTGRYGTVYSLEGTGASTETFTYSVPKNGATVLVFFKGTGACGNSNAFFQGLYETQWAYDESINIVAVETSKASRATVQSYFDAYDPDGLVDHVYYNSSSNYVAFWYKGLVGMDSSSISFACAMIVTENNGTKYIQYVKEGMASSTDLTYTLGQLVDISDPEAKDKLVEVTVPGSKRFDYAKQVFDSVNTQRENAGVQSLTYSAQLTEMAMQRAAECAIYYSHTRPNRESWSTIFEEYPLYTGSYLGANIAYGYDTPASVMTGWMDSTGNRENILRSTSTQIGVGCFENNGTLYWVQLFGAGSDSVPADESNVPANVPVNTFASMLDVYTYGEESLTVEIGGEVALPKLYTHNSGGMFSSVILPKISQVKDETGTVLATATVETGTGEVMLTGVHEGSGTVELRAYEGQENVPSVPLTVKSNLAITSQPKSVAITAGTAVEFSVTATGSGLTYQWQYKDAGSTMWASTSAVGNTTAVLTVPAEMVVVGADGRQYRCKITDSSGKVVYSTAATLTVKPADTTERPVTASGYCGGEGDGTNLSWTLYSDGELVISGTGKMDDWSVTLSPPWYARRNTINSVTISDGAATIGDYAFSACDFLTSVVIPGSVISIGDNAFMNCDILTLVNMEDGVISIGEKAFAICRALKSINIPDSVTTIENAAFFYCDALKTVIMGSNVTYIGYGVFDTCNALTRVEFLGDAPATVYDSDIDVGTIYYHDGTSGWSTDGTWQGRPLKVTPHTEVAMTDVAPTCGADGSTGGMRCSGCKQVLVEPTIVPATGQHGYQLDEAMAPTCTESGLTVGASCPTCGYIHLAQEVVPATGHISVTDPAVDETCTEDGLAEGSHCGTCGEVLVEQEIVPAAHTLVIDPAVEATCKQTGLTEGSHCGACGEVLVAQQEVAKTTHTVVIDQPKEPTCTEVGYSSTGMHCGACGEVLLAQTEIPATGHNEVTDAGIAATCTATGLTEGTHCDTCGEVVLAQTEIPATGHNEVTDTGIAATCTATGLTEGTRCDTCGEVLLAQTEIPATGHDEVTDAGVAATCTATGLTEGSHCGICGEVMVAQQTLDKTNHTVVVDQPKDPTCTENGYSGMGVHCDACGEVLLAQTEIPALGHDCIDHAAQEPTTESVGWEAYQTCSRCDYSTYKELPKLEEKPVVTPTRFKFSLEVIKTIKVDGQNVDICRWVWTPAE